MTIAVQNLLATFDQLNDVEKREALSEILRRTSVSSSPPLEDDDLIAAAESLFLELDAREAANGQA